MSIGPILNFVHDDLSGDEIRALIALHLERMHAQSPPESVHAYAMDQLRARDVRFWSAWLGGDLVGCGALKLLDARRGEIKSMRIADPYLGRGYGRAILYHLIREAKGLALQSLWLETGSTLPFTPALRLYQSAGFVRCGPFDDYVEDAFSIFMTREI